MKHELRTVISFAERLESASIDFRTGFIRAGHIMFQIAVPGERWEVEFSDDGEVEIEVFRSDGGIRGAEAIDDLFERFAG